MNIATFNDEFASTIQRLHGPTEWSQWARAPLFEFDVVSATEVWLSEQPVISEPDSVEVFFPFPRFRIDLQFRDRHCSCFVRRTDIGTELFGATNCAWSEGGRVTMRWVMSNQGEMSLMSYHDAQDGREVKPSDFPESKYQRDLAVGISVFCLEVQKPTNYIARVCPNKSGKSAEWIEARTHYVFIKHDDPRNVIHPLPGVLGARALSPRMAHARRSHFKTLRSPRYRWKMGQRVFVKAAWIGPKEWEDNGGKQIYRIIELAAA